MKKLHFTYDMQIEYSIEVSDCHFTIKCIPTDTRRQKIHDIRITLDPETAYQWGKDGMGNTQIWGGNRKPHYTFRFRIEGEAETGLSAYEEDADENLAMIFAHPHGRSSAGERIIRFYKEKIENTGTCTSDRVLHAMHCLYEAYTYQKGMTNVDTYAEEAFAQGCGVCQDYAHILIALLHLGGIPARYVTGFIIGEGQSHAWVEYLDHGKWYGVDPTNNKLVNEEYIRIGHGRDAKDCLINRGIMRGGGFHSQTVSVNVQEVQRG